MDRLGGTEAAQVVEYLRQEVPWELERLESLDLLVHSWLDWADAGEGSRQVSYSSWLRTTYGLFRRPRAHLIEAPASAAP